MRAPASDQFSSPAALTQPAFLPSFLCASPIASSQQRPQFCAVGLDCCPSSCPQTMCQHVVQGVHAPNRCPPSSNFHRFIFLIELCHPAQLHCPLLCRTPTAFHCPPNSFPSPIFAMPNPPRLLCCTTGDSLPRKCAVCLALCNLPSLVPRSQPQNLEDASVCSAAETVGAAACSPRVRQACHSCSRQQPRRYLSASCPTLAVTAFAAG